MASRLRKRGSKRSSGSNRSSALRAVQRSRRGSVQTFQSFKPFKTSMEYNPLERGSMFNVLTSNVFRNTNLLTTKKIHERF